MSAIRAFGAGMREVFTLREAERKSAAYAANQLAEVRRNKSIAWSRLRASRRMANAPAALLVLHDAALHALAAAHAASDLGGAFDAKAELDAAFPQKLDELEFSDAETLRDRVETFVTTLLGSVESRTRTELVGLRVGRVLALLLLVFLIARPFVRDKWLVHDVALHKLVTTSPMRHPPANAEGVVDGRTRGTYAVQTLEQKNPFVTVDLERPYAIQRVVIYNRGDGWFDEILPLTLELSDDGLQFHQVARRTEHFDAWKVDLGGQSAKFVRVTKESGYIALNEIEVYARE
jgi:hypothetical protein